MSLSAQLKWKLALALFIVLALACDTGSLLSFGAPTSIPYSGPGQYPTTVTLGTAGQYRPSSAGWIAYITQGNLWLIHPDGSAPKQITQNPAPSPSSSNTGFTLHWSPDGTMLGYAVGGKLTVLDIGSLQATLRANATAGDFDWSGNSQQIIYDGPLTTDASGKSSNNGLWLVDVNSGQTKQLLAASPTYPGMLSPLWSSDATRVIFSDASGRAHLLNLVNGSITDLPQGTAKDHACTWAAKIMLIACLDSNPSGGLAPSIAFLDQDGHENLDIELPANHFQPSLGPWAPDGKSIALIYSADASGSKLMSDVLSIESGDFKSYGAGRLIDWSSDGRWVMLAGTEGDAQPLTIINTTSGLTSTLTDGAPAAWQPGVGVVSGAPTPSFCMNTSGGFVHMKPKGYFLTFCLGAQHITYPSLEAGVYAMGPHATYFVYVSNSGYVFAARVGDPALTRIGDVRNFISIRLHEDMEPKFQIRFIAGYPYEVQVVELTFNEKETFMLPTRIYAP